jgi:hypothetical protein
LANLTEVQRELKFRQYADDPIAFFRECWWITHPIHGKVLFNLRPEQIETLGVYMTEKMVVVLKARQIGWSTLTTAYAFWAAFFHPDRKVIFISRRENEAKDLLAMAKYGFDRMPDWLRRRGPQLVQDNLRRMPFDNGSVIISDSVAADPARGQTAWLVVMDEAASIPSPEDAWASIEPTTDIGGRAIILSTAKGSGDWFHAMWNRANDPRTRFRPLFYSWRVVPERDDPWYEAKSFEMEPWQLHQEYPDNPEEAFLRSGNMFFDIDVLRSITTKVPEIGDVDDYKFTPSEAGRLRLFEPSQGEKKSNYVIGADVAEGLPGGDYTSAHVINARTGVVAAHWHGHIEADEFGDVLYELGRYYGEALIAVENASHGSSTLHRLRQLGYPNIFVSRTMGQRFDKQTERLGWLTNKATKPRMMDELARALRYPEDGGVTLYCVETLKELLGYVRDTEDGKLHGSPHDDRVVSLAIANQMLAFAYDPKYAPKVNNEWTVGWFSDMLLKEKAEARQHGEMLVGQSAMRRER